MLVTMPIAPDITDKNDYLHKRLTWDEAVSLFPDRWVSFSNYVLDGVTFKNGVLEDVFKDDEHTNYVRKHWHDDLQIMRTSSNLSVGYN